MPPTSWKRMARSNRLGSFVYTAPPSPAEIVLFTWSDAIAIWPIEPSGLPLKVAPTDCETSSSTFRLCLRAIASSASILAGFPCRCTAISTRVRGVMCRSISAGSRLKDESISAQMGSAPAITTALKQECQVQAGTITSSPGPISRAAMATCNAAVPEVTPNAYFVCIKPANSRSNVATLGGITERSIPQKRNGARASSTSLRKPHSIWS